jgi:hypothetical protein
VPDWDNTESRESDEDAAWRDLVARFEEPPAPMEVAPWPERENVPGPRPQPSPRTDEARAAESAPDGRGEAPGPADLGDSRAAGDPDKTGGALGTPGDGTARGTPGDGTARGTPGDEGTQEARGAEGIRGFDDEGVRGAFGADPPPGTREPDVIQAARRDRRAPAHGNGMHGTRSRRIRARRAPPRPAQEDDGEHYIPPTPPPLPKLDPITKGAWVALFGGPAYLVVATAVGWSIPGVAAFLAVAAFVTGFAVLVLRMNDPGPGGPDDGDDGAVV